MTFWKHSLYLIYFHFLFCPLSSGENASKLCMARFAYLSTPNYGYFREVCVLHWAEPRAALCTQYIMEKVGFDRFLSSPRIQLHVLLNYI